ncbi:C1_2 domain-containing protein [Psidium guajava]|nr:C1_2 domain-containing protein [Psidium guajava]
MCFITYTLVKSHLRLIASGLITRRERLFRTLKYVDLISRYAYLLTAAH